MRALQRSFDEVKSKGKSQQPAAQARNSGLFEPSPASVDGTPSSLAEPSRTIGQVQFQADGLFAVANEEAIADQRRMVPRLPLQRGKPG